MKPKCSTKGCKEKATAFYSKKSVCSACWFALRRKRSILLKALKGGIQQNGIN
jgi:hypothetical protein